MKSVAEWKLEIIESVFAFQRGASHYGLNRIVGMLMDYEKSEAEKNEVESRELLAEIERRRAG